jgi:hypothetical protein
MPPLSFVASAGKVFNPLSAPLHIHHHTTASMRCAAHHASSSSRNPPLRQLTRQRAAVIHAAATAAAVVRTQHSQYSMHGPPRQQQQQQQQQQRHPGHTSAPTYVCRVLTESADMAVGAKAPDFEVVCLLMASHARGGGTCEGWGSVSGLLHVKGGVCV